MPELRPGTHWSSGPPGGGSIWRRDPRRSGHVHLLMFLLQYLNRYTQVCGHDQSRYQHLNSHSRRFRVISSWNVRMVAVTVLLNHLEVLWGLPMSKDMDPRELWRREERRWMNQLPDHRAWRSRAREYTTHVHIIATSKSWLAWV